MRRWAGVRGPNDQSDIMKNLLISGQVSVFAKVLNQIDKSIYGFYEISCFSNKCMIIDVNCIQLPDILFSDLLFCSYLSIQLSALPIYLLYSLSIYLSDLQSICLSNLRSFLYPNYRLPCLFILLSIHLDAPGRSGGSRRRSGARPNYLDQSFSNDEAHFIYLINLYMIKSSHNAGPDLYCRSQLLQTTDNLIVQPLKI